MAASDDEPLELLRSGNERFVNAIKRSPDPAAAAEALSRAEPYAIVLGCSDSRVPPEIIFDESIGRLFVIRVASNAAGSDETGTIEYALGRWGCPLLVVLGHSQCGGVAAAMDRLPAGADATPSVAGASSLTSLLSATRANLGWSGTTSDDPWLDAVRMNVTRTIANLVTWSVPIRERVESGCLKIVGAVYHVETGQVEFLEP
jgi:carbonic anhydrase